MEKLQFLSKEEKGGIVTVLEKIKNVSQAFIDEMAYQYQIADAEHLHYKARLSQLTDFCQEIQKIINKEGGVA